MAQVEFREPEEPIAVYLISTWLWLAARSVLTHGRAAPCGTLQVTTKPAAKLPSADHRATATILQRNGKSGRGYRGGQLA